MKAVLLLAMGLTVAWSGDAMAAPPTFGSLSLGMSKTAAKAAVADGDWADLVDSPGEAPTDLAWSRATVIVPIEGDTFFLLLSFGPGGLSGIRAENQTLGSRSDCLTRFKRYAASLEKQLGPLKTSPRSGLRKGRPEPLGQASVMTVETLPQKQGALWQTAFFGDHDRRKVFMELSASYFADVEGPNCRIALKLDG